MCCGLFLDAMLQCLGTYTRECYREKAGCKYTLQMVVLNRMVSGSAVYLLSYMQYNMRKGRLTTHSLLQDQPPLLELATCSLHIKVSSPILLRHQLEADTTVTMFNLLRLMPLEETGIV